MAYGITARRRRRRGGGWDCCRKPRISRARNTRRACRVRRNGCAAKGSSQRRPRRGTSSRRRPPTSSPNNPPIDRRSGVVDKERDRAHGHTERETDEARHGEPMVDRCVADEGAADQDAFLEAIDGARCLFEVAGGTGIEVPPAVSPNGLEQTLH